MENKRKTFVVVENKSSRRTIFYLARLSDGKYLTSAGGFTPNLADARAFANYNGAEMAGTRKGYVVKKDTRVRIVTNRVSFFRWFRILRHVPSGNWIQPNGNLHIDSTVAEAFWSFGARRRATKFAKKHGYIVV